MYCTWAACPACAAAIAHAGIDTVYILQAAHDKTPDRWAEEVDQGHEILRTAGVTVIRVEEKLDTVLRMNGEWFEV